MKAVQAGNETAGSADGLCSAARMEDHQHSVSVEELKARRIAPLLTMLLKLVPAIRKCTV